MFPLFSLAQLQGVRGVLRSMPRLVDTSSCLRDKPQGRLFSCQCHAQPEKVMSVVHGMLSLKKKTPHADDGVRMHRHIATASLKTLRRCAGAIRRMLLTL